MTSRIRLVTALVSAFLTMGLVAVPALATTINTSMGGYAWHSTSGHWGDENTASGTSIRLENCRTTNSSYTFSYTVVTLWRQRGALPDETRGDRTYYCYNGVTQSWSTPSSDTYYFETASIWNQSGVACVLSCRLSANPVRIGF
ncbi:hypothetical protein [Terrabacter sp. C0L_2]|jgi:hypothetical protein|uniref:hypothetical protein n=1 Tax=Terrabacter sp. C0L_2 TaxID=3108389 RepID=UPI002ED2031D|nr:hypothetical protein U5C87_09450 [Terrabacter sp. C0L_2]